MRLTSTCCYGAGAPMLPWSVEQNAPLDLTRMEITEEELNSEVELVRDDEVLHRSCRRPESAGAIGSIFYGPGKEMPNGWSGRRDSWQRN